MCVGGRSSVSNELCELHVSAGVVGSVFMGRKLQHRVVDDPKQQLLHKTGPSYSEVAGMSHR